MKMKKMCGLVAFFLMLVLAGCASEETGGITRIIPPVLSSEENGEYGVKLKWTASSDAIYRLYRNNVLIFEGKINEYEDYLTAGANESYKVKCIKGDKESIFSNDIIIKKSDYKKIFDSYMLSENHLGEITTMDVSNNESILVTGSADRTIKIWNLSDPDASKWDVKRTIIGHSRKITALSVSPDASTIVSGSEDKSIKLWDATKNEPLSRSYVSDSVVLSLKIDSKGKYIAWNSLDNQISIKTISDDSIKTLQNSSPYFTADDEMVKIAAASLKDVTIFKYMQLFNHTEQRGTGTISGVSLNGAGDALAVSSDANIYIYNLSDNAPVVEWSREKFIIRDTSSIRYVKMNRAGTYIATINDDNQLKVWSNMGRLIKTLSTQSKLDIYKSVWISNDGNRVIVAVNDRIVVYQK